MLEPRLFDDINQYHFSPQLRDAVRTAYFLQMPLLLTGEPGTGKTKIAAALKEVLEKAYPTEQVNDYTFNTKSISVYKDLLYQYDYLKHFQDAQLQREQAIEKYITYNALGQALLAATHSIVLIDEIDKAPRDFPNDLLDILENSAFEIPELQNKRYTSTIKPFIIITSNSEKNLPDAFLRRCIYYHIYFPSDEALAKILLKHFETNKAVKANLRTIEQWFVDVRKNLHRKNPSTAELIAWLSLMINYNFPFDQLIYGQLEHLNPSQKEQLRLSFSVLAKTQEDLKKLREDHIVRL